MPKRQPIFGRREYVSPGEVIDWLEHIGERHATHCCKVAK
jgi:hypothetical protein